VLRNKLYLIKVDSVRKAAVLDKNNKIRVGAMAAFSKENETMVAKITWLSNKESAKAYSSMIIYLIKSSNAWRFLADRFFHTRGESRVTSVFKYRLYIQYNAITAKRLAIRHSSIRMFRSA
jgi:hypothetical protein